MRKLDEIATDLRGLLSAKFQTVRISALQTADQLLTEIQSIHPEKMPGVIIGFDNLKFDGSSMTNTLKLKLILVDQFRSGSDERALSVFQAGSDLLELFPGDGRQINGVWYYPLDCAVSTPDVQYAALAVGLEIKQGSISG